MEDRRGEERILEEGKKGIEGNRVEQNMKDNLTHPCFSFSPILMSPQLHCHNLYLLPFRVHIKSPSFPCIYLRQGSLSIPLLSRMDFHLFIHICLLLDIPDSTIFISLLTIPMFILSLSNFLFLDLDFAWTLWCGGLFFGLGNPFDVQLGCGMELLQIV